MRRVSTLRTNTNSTNGLSSGCLAIDRVFDIDGLKPGYLYEFFGAAGAGKTQLSLQYLSFNTPSAYISTESFTAVSKRLHDIIASTENFNIANIEKKLSSIYIDSANTAKELWHFVRLKLEKLVQLKQLKLIIIDSITAIFRTGVEFEASKAEYIERTKWLFEIVANLKAICSKYACTIIITNQVSKNISLSQVVPALGLSWSYCIDTRIRIEKKSYDEEGQVKRELKIIFSNCFPEKKTVLKMGISGLQE